MTNFFIDDIPYQTAFEAHRNTSEVPERRARSVQQDYAETLSKDFQELQEEAYKHEFTNELDAILLVEFEKYRQGYKQRYIKYLQTRARVVSVLICGPANFPTRRNQKWNDISSKRLQELIDYRKNALAAINRKMHPELAPIMAGDDDAIPRLEAKIAEAEKSQELMKNINLAIRANTKKGEQAVKDALSALGLDYQYIHKILTPNYLGNIGIESWQLQNNNANIRRMKERLEKISADKAAVKSCVETESGIRIEDCPADNRVRIFFPGKPDADVRAALKSNGFRWAPSVGAWQAYRNFKAINHANSFVKQTTSV